jgi:hypothetical protein
VNDHFQLATIVDIAPDGRTAQARGVELSVSGLKGKAGQWEEGIFENEYVKQDGTWKIRSVHYYPRFITDYELGWARDAKPAAGPTTEFPPDRPPTESYSTYPKMFYPRFHGTNPVTHSSVQYPPGTMPTVAGPSSKKVSSNPVALPTAPRNVKEFTARLSELERQVDASTAYDAAENLINAHGYYLDDSRDDRLQEIFANTPERRSPREPEPGAPPAIHQTVQPVIQLSSDGKSATIRARLLKIGGAGELASGAYEGRLRLQDGIWKFQSLTLKRAWSSPFSRWAPTVERGR